jgi:hypothetical protein
MSYSGTSSRKRVVSFSLTVSIFVILATLFSLNFQSTVRAQGIGDLDDGIRPLAFKHPVLGPPGITPAGIFSPLPYRTSSFTYNGQVYPYRMLGSSPASNTSTTLLTMIVPLSFSFSNGTTLDSTSQVPSVLNSPLYQNASFLSGNTQYADAIQRAEFWNTVSTTSPNYHVLLRNISVHPALRFIVPAGQGTTVTGKASGTQVGLVNNTWLYPQLTGAIAALNIPASVTPIFLSNNVYLYIGTTANCCIGGFHNALTIQRPTTLRPTTYTFIFSAYLAPGVFGANSGDVTALSHEVAEWINDPFANNRVPPWTAPGASQYGCSNILETGDPLVGVNFIVNGYHLQDEVFLSWFAHQSPSPAYGGRYTYLDTFSTLPSTC